MSYDDIIKKEPSLLDHPGMDEAKDDFYFINAKSIRKKVRFARHQGLWGVMLWEVGQDKGFFGASKNTEGSLLKHIRAAVEEDLQRTWEEFLDMLSARSPISEVQLILGLSSIAGGGLL